MATKTFGFGLRAFKKHPELIPLAFFIGAIATMATSYSVYALRTKPDVRMIGRNIEMPYELVEPTESRKIVNLNQKYEVVPERENIRKEIGSFKN